MSYRNLAGAASAELVAQAHDMWLEAAGKADVDITGFDRHAPLAERIAWALQMGLVIACVYSRYSTKRQRSTSDQVRENIVWAARNGMYVPPEFVSVDEGINGKRVERDGLERTKAILRETQASVMLVYKVSRLFRVAYKGYQLIQEEIVDNDLRAVSVSQGIDTADAKVWKAQLQIHGMADEMLVDAIGDHVRSGQKGIFLQGYPTGALPIGFQKREVPDAPKTKRGLVRTVPEIHPLAGELIRKHAQLHLEGMSLAEGRRRWIEAGGPTDPRAHSPIISAISYRNLWRNEALTGRWHNGRK